MTYLKWWCGGGVIMTSFYPPKLMGIWLPVQDVESSSITLRLYTTTVNLWLWLNPRESWGCRASDSQSSPVLQEERGFEYNLTWDKHNWTPIKRVQLEEMTIEECQLLADEIVWNSEDYRYWVCGGGSYTFFQGLCL